MARAADVYTPIPAALSPSGRQRRSSHQNVNQRSSIRHNTTAPLSSTRALRHQGPPPTVHGAAAAALCNDDDDFRGSTGSRTRPLPVDSRRRFNELRSSNGSSRLPSVSQSAHGAATDLRSRSDVVVVNDTVRGLPRRGGRARPGYHQPSQNRRPGVYAAESFASGGRSEMPRGTTRQNAAAASSGQCFVGQWIIVV